jgi:hypothetical protein
MGNFPLSRLDQEGALNRFTQAFVKSLWFPDGLLWPARITVMAKH